jgi:upstream activation factor subunit UAF30
MAAPTAQDLEGAIRVILATAKLEDVTQRTLREQVRGVGMRVLVGGRPVVSRLPPHSDPHKGARGTISDLQSTTPPSSTTHTLHTPPTQLEGQFGCELAAQKSVIKEITIRVLSEREEDAEAQEAQEKAAAKAAIKREVNLAPQHSSDDESQDGSSSGSDEEEEEVKPKLKKAKREVDEDGGEEGVKVAKKKGGGFNKEQAWSEEMTAFLGVGYMSRPQVTKRVWDYIKEKNLQNPVDRRVILCDPMLKSLFGGVEKINMFKMPKAINKHVRYNDREGKMEEEDEEEEEDEDSDDEGDSRKRKASSAAKAKTEKKKRKEKKAAAAAAAATPAKKKKKTANKEEGEGASAKKGGGRGFPQEKISRELQVLVGKETASRNEVVKKLWEHIKANDMQDPAVSLQFSLIFLLLLIDRSLLFAGVVCVVCVCVCVCVREEAMGASRLMTCRILRYVSPFSSPSCLCPFSLTLLFISASSCDPFCVFVCVRSAFYLCPS